MILWLKKKQKKRKKISIKNVFHATYWIYWQTQRLTTCERVKAEAIHTKNSNNNLIYLIDMMMTKFFRIYCLRHLFFPSTTCKKKAFICNVFLFLHYIFAYVFMLSLTFFLEVKKWNCWFSFYFNEKYYKGKNVQVLYYHN